MTYLFSFGGYAPKIIFIHMCTRMMNKSTLALFVFLNGVAIDGSGTIVLLLYSQHVGAIAENISACA